MIRTLVISLLVAAWLSLVYSGKKERLQYVSESLPIASPNQFIGVQSGKLFFSGFSPSSATARGSNSTKPSICFRPDRGSNAAADRILITIDADFIAPLVGRTVRVHIGDDSFEYLVTAKDQHEFVDGRSAQFANGLVCVKFDLPITLTSMWNFRGLGMTFGGLRYRYATREQQSRAAPPLGDRIPA